MVRSKATRRRMTKVGTRSTASKKRQKTAKRIREMASYRRYRDARAIRKENERLQTALRIEQEQREAVERYYQQMLRHPSMQRHMEARSNPYGRLGQKRDEADFYMNDY